MKNDDTTYEFEVQKRDRRSLIHQLPTFIISWILVGIPLGFGLGWLTDVVPVLGIPLALLTIAGLIFFAESFRARKIIIKPDRIVIATTTVRRNLMRRDIKAIRPLNRDEAIKQIKKISVADVCCSLTNVVLIEKEKGFDYTISLVDRDKFLECIKTVWGDEKLIMESPESDKVNKIRFKMSPSQKKTIIKVSLIIFIVGAMLYLFDNNHLPGFRAEQLPISVEEDNIRIALIQYQLDHLDQSHLVYDYKTACVGMGKFENGVMIPIDPSEHIISQLDAAPRKVTAASNCETKFDTGVLDKETQGKAIGLFVGKIEWVSPNKVKVGGSLYQGSLAATGHDYTLKKKRKGWKVTRDEVTWFS